MLRFAGYLPHSMRLFLQSGTNLADVGLAIVTSIIQIPFIKRSVVYPWLTVFQIARFYRVIVAFPRTGNLLVRYYLFSFDHIFCWYITPLTADANPPWIRISLTARFEGQSQRIG